MTVSDEKPPCAGGLTGRPFANLALPGDSVCTAVSVASFRHFRTKAKNKSRRLDNAQAETAIERIALSASGTTRVTTSEWGRAVRVQLRDVVIVVARDRDFSESLFVVSAFVVGLPDHGDHFTRILAVAAEVSVLTSVADRLSLLGPP
jgi:hypothetical protein